MPWETRRLSGQEAKKRLKNKLTPEERQQSREITQQMDEINRQIKSGELDLEEGCDRVLALSREAAKLLLLYEED